MDLENEKIGPAFKAPDSYFKETESRLLQRLGIQADVQEKVVDIQTGDIAQPTIQQVSVAAPLNTAGVQKRARKQDPMTAKSEGINKEVDALGNVVIAPLTFTTNENPEWVNFGVIEVPLVVESSSELEAPMIVEESVVPSKEVMDVVEPTLIVHEVPESVGLDELESYVTAKVQEAEPSPNAIPSPKLETVSAPKEVEEKPISLEAPATAFAPIAGRQHESATPGWLGVAAALAAIVAAYFIWTAIQPPKLDTEQVVLQEEEATIPDAPLDEQVQTDTIPDGRQIVEPLILEEMPKYNEPNVYTIIDAADMPERTKRALQDLEDHGLATFDMEDELFEELDFESL